MQTLRAVLAVLILVAAAVAGQTSEKSNAVSINPNSNGVVPEEVAVAAPVTNCAVSSTDAINIPQMMSYQGRLTDATGVPVPDGSYGVMFKLYTAPTGGSPFWSETQSVTTRDGLFSVLLGAVTPIGPVPDAGAAYLGMAVEGSVEMVPRLRIAGMYAGPAEQVGVNYGPGGGTDDDDEWVHSDSVLFTIRRLGIARGGINNKLYGSYACSHTNLGNACTTGTSGYDFGNITIGGGYGNRARAPYTAVCGGRNNKAGNGATDTSAIVVGGYGNQANAKFAFVGGGSGNTASGNCATVVCGDENTAGGYCAAVGGGSLNAASGLRATVGGGYYNAADSGYATVGGGSLNTASGEGATVGGGESNTASGEGTTVGGGYDNTASGWEATVGGGESNTASGFIATVPGGYNNAAGGWLATVGGGQYNAASGSFSTVAGGYRDTAAGKYGFATGLRSVARSADTNSAAFNGTRTSAHRQTRVYNFAQALGALCLDHPLDQHGKILNQYTIASSEMVLFYRGAATVGSDGRVTVSLPDYFDALCKNPMVQLTGVGTYEVCVAAEIKGNTFAIGGRPGVKVFWTVTAERKDPVAEQSRKDMPVEQTKADGLAGRSVNGLW